MSLENKFNDFKSKYIAEEKHVEAMAAMLKIFNDSFIELAHKLLNEKETTNVKTYTGTKKWATKIAAEYADDNGVSLDNFNKEKVTKKDIDEFLKTNKKEIPKLITETIKKEPKKDFIRCKGLTKDGEPCNREGTEKPEGSHNCYCFRHAMDWKNYEVSSDSDMSENHEEST